MRIIIILLIFSLLFPGCAKRSSVQMASLSGFQFSMNSGLGYAERGAYSYTLFNNRVLITENDKEIINKTFESVVTAFYIDASSDLIAALSDGTIIEIDTATKKIIDIDSFFEPIKLLKVSPDNNLIITVSENNKIVFFNRTTKNISMGSYNEEITDINLSDDTKKIYIRFEKKIIVLDFQDKKELMIISDN